MEITRDLLASTRWQCANGRKKPITEMDDNHIKNSIRMLKRQGNEDSYACDLLKAEQTFRARDKQSKQMSLLDMFEDVHLPITTEHAPPPTVRVKAKGKIIDASDTRSLMAAVDAIGMKHHGIPSGSSSFWDCCDDPRDYGYDGDCY